ncbi:MAG: TIGR02530 family flagellar biosynthesis protein [Dethiobacteria bacterium]|jgi:flagellar operon protein|nr:hypothetical protein [Bacillota bacterium]
MTEVWNLGIDKEKVWLQEIKSPEAAKGLRPGKRPRPGTSFEELLQEQLKGPLTFSAHSRRRIESRNIKLQENDLQKIAAAVEKAASKGARSSLLLYRDLALLVSVNKRTIITAMETRETEKIFTNIDSAVIIE